MGAQVFYRKYRSQLFAELFGQDHVTRTLLNALKNDRISHAYLFCGPRGTGKTSTGRLLAKAVNCLTGGKGEPCNTCTMCRAITEGRALDVIEIDAASNTGVDNIRDLRERVNYAPNEARYKVYIIDEVHMLSTSASNALLKTLEEPPPHAIFILATTETHKVLPTIISRCQRFDFHRISQSDIVNRLTQICTAENVQIPPDGLKLIAKSATGSLRDAENLLEQMITFYGTDIELAQIKATLGITGDARSKELVKNIIDNDITAGIKTVHDVNSDGLDLKQFAGEVRDQFRELLLVKTNVNDSASLTAEDLAEIKAIAGKASLIRILNAVKVFSQIDIGLDNYSTLPLELAIVDCIQTTGEEKSSPAAGTVTKAEPAPAVVKSTPPPAASIVQAIKPQPVKTSAIPDVKAPAAKTGTTPARQPEPPPVAVVKDTLPAAANKDDEIEKLKQNWKQILDNAPAEIKRTSAVALLRSGKPIEIQGNRVTIAFRYPIHKDNIEKPDNRKNAEKLISEYLGRTCSIYCIHKPEASHLVDAAIKMGAQIISVEEK